MSTTYVFRAWVGSGVNSTSGTAYGGNPAWTVPSNILNTTTVNIVIQHSSLNNGGYLTCSGSGTNASDYYLCDSDGNNAVKIQSFSYNGGYSWNTNNNPVNLNIRALAGKKLYVKEVKTSGNGVHIRGDCAITITYNTYTDATAPTTVGVSRTRGTVTISWSGQQGGTNNNISGYTVIRNTSASTSGSTSISTPTASPVTNAPAAGTYYYGVCTRAGYNTSGYTWSSAITVPSKPSVAAGDKITEAKMDDLRIWINGSQTNVTAGDIAYASHGNTYRSGLTAGTTQFDDAWYNAAANG